MPTRKDYLLHEYSQFSGYGMRAAAPYLTEGVITAPQASSEGPDPAAPAPSQWAQIKAYFAADSSRKYYWGVAALLVLFAFFRRK